MPTEPFVTLVGVVACTVIILLLLLPHAFQSVVMRVSILTKAALLGILFVAIAVLRATLK